MLKFILLFSFLTTQVWAGSSTIEKVILDYFHGYQKADVVLIKNAFHPATRLLSVDQGKLDVTDMSTWLKSLEDRRLRGDIRIGKLKIESVNVTHDTAAVKLKIRFEKFEFTDYLSLLKIEGKWVIVGKIYHFQEIL